MFTACLLGSFHRKLTHGYLGRVRCCLGYPLFVRPSASLCCAARARHAQSLLCLPEWHRNSQQQVLHPKPRLLVPSQGPVSCLSCFLFPPHPLPKKTPKPQTDICSSSKCILSLSPTPTSLRETPLVNDETSSHSPVLLLGRYLLFRGNKTVDWISHPYPRLQFSLSFSFICASFWNLFQVTFSLMKVNSRT